MLRRLVGPILHPNFVLTSFGVVVALISGWQVIALIYSDARWAKLSTLSTFELAGLLGLFLIILLIARSLICDLWNSLVKEKRIVCGSGQAGTPYDYRSLLLRDPTEVFVITQNMRTLLSDKEYLPSISQWLARNGNRKPSLTFVLCKPNVLGVLNPTAKNHLKQSVVELRNFLKTRPVNDQITIRFHSSTISLSAFVCDPKSKERGIMVFTPKWGLDAQPANRLYCVVERWEHDDLFNLIAGAIPAMVQNDSLSLDQVCTELGV
jgi:hypothetical protein